MSIRLGINPLTWTNDDLPSLGDETSLEVCLQQSREAGFVGVELGRKFPRQAAILKPLLDRYDLTLASGWYSSRLLERSVADEIEALKPHLELLAAFDAKAVVYCEVSRCTHLDLARPLSQRPRLIESDWSHLLHSLNEIAAYMQSQGFELAYHHHMGTVIQNESDICRLMDETESAVGLLLDTGHCTFAGANPLALAKRYGDRIRHVHCKDARGVVVGDSLNRDMSFLNSVLNGVFTVPGDGNLDFTPIFEQLKRVNYQGWLICEAEQDPALALSLPFAQKGFQRLHELSAVL